MRWYLVLTLDKLSDGVVVDGVYATCQDEALRMAIARNGCGHYVKRTKTVAEAGYAKRRHDEKNVCIYSWWTKEEFIEFMNIPAYMGRQRT